VDGAGGVAELPAAVPEVPVYVYALHAAHHQAFDQRKQPFGEDGIINEAATKGPPRDLPLAQDHLMIRADLIPQLMRKGIFAAFSTQCNAGVNQKWRLAARDDDNNIVYMCIISHVRVFVLLQLYIFAINAGTAGAPVGYKALHVQVLKHISPRYLVHFFQPLFFSHNA
jgi:hypothetical protein